MQRESRFLLRALNKRVECALDKPDRHEQGVLVGFTAGGAARVQFDDGRTRPVACWRIRVLPDAAGGKA